MSEKISIFAPKYGLIPSVPSLLCDGAQRSCGNHQSFVIHNSDTTYSKQRIVRNTGLLYGRMLLTVWFNLWATRLTLANLGVDDLGVFGVVGSVVSMFAVFSNGLTTAVQRFITYELGRGKKGEVDRVFSTSLNVLLLLALATVIIIEPVGLTASLVHILVEKNRRNRYA